MKNPRRKRQHILSRELRRQQTDSELKLWSLLRSNQLQNHKFRRQHAIRPYVVDFYCPKKKLIIEVDGSQHMERKEYDEKRTHFLQQQGYYLVRFWANQVLRENKLVMTVILNELANSPPHPSPLPLKMGEGNRMGSAQPIL